MRATHKLTQRKHASVQKAILAHEAHTNWVLANVKKHGLKKVICTSEVAHAEDYSREIHMLKKQYLKLLKFAEDCMIKQLPTEINGDLNITGNQYTDRLLERMEIGAN